jgi:hypothetical protein
VRSERKGSLFDPEIGYHFTMSDNIKEVVGVVPFFKCMSSHPCPVCKTMMVLVATTNRWTNYCKKCDERFDDKHNRMSEWL